MWDSGSAGTVFGPVKEMLSESAERCGGCKRENRLFVLAFAPVQGRLGGRTGEGKAAFKADGSRVGNGS